jgi:hypothetical protein
MISGRINIERFGCQVIDAEGKKIIDGKVTDESVPIKLLIIQEQGGLQLFFTFTPEELENFIGVISGKKIIPAANFIPPLLNPLAHRN